MVLLAADAASPGAAGIITALAVLLTAFAAVIGAVAGLRATWRKRALVDSPAGEEDPLAVQRERLWLELLEQLDTLGEEAVNLRREKHELTLTNDRLTRELHDCNGERLDLLRQRGRPGERW